MSTSRTRTARLGALTVALVAAVGLSSCVGIGAVNRDAVDRRARERGGGITADLVGDAVEAVASEIGDDTPQVLTLVASFSEVDLVVADPSSPDRAQRWRYGTSGLYGGRGLTGPEPERGAGEQVTGRLYTPEQAGLARLDAMVDTALEEAGLPDGWVERATVARPAAGRAPATTLAVTDGYAEVTVVVDPDGTVVGRSDG